MNVKAWLIAIGVLVAGAVALPSVARAEKVKTNQSAKLYTRAGEQSQVLLKLKSGQTMTVLAKDGRWLKVRVSGRTGWVPRSKVDMPDDEEIGRNTRRRPFVDGRGTKRGFGGETGPDDRIGADATGEGDEPRSGKSKKPSKDDDEDEPRSSKKKASRGDDDDRKARGRSARRGGDDSDDGDDKPPRGDA